MLRRPGPNSLFAYLARDARPPDWVESTQTALQILAGGGVILLLSAWADALAGTAFGLIFCTAVYNLLVAGRLAITSATLTAYLTHHIQRFDLIRVSLLTDAGLIRTLFGVTFFVSRRSLAEALGGWLVMLVGFWLRPVWGLRQGADWRDYLMDGMAWGVACVGLWLFHGLGAMIGIVASLTIRRPEAAVSLALALILGVEIGLFMRFVNVSVGHFDDPLSPFLPIFNCLLPIILLIGGSYGGAYFLLRRH